MKLKKVNAYIYKSTNYNCSFICLRTFVYTLVKLFSKTVFLLPSTEASSYSEEMLGLIKVY